jgi:hypothetical protein
MGRGRGWWRIALVALLCSVGLIAGAERDGAEAAARPRITWTFDDPILPIDACQKASYLPQTNYFRVDVCPGQLVRVTGTFTPDQDVAVPRLILQTPSGARIMRLEHAALGNVIPAGTTTDFAVLVEPPPGYRNSRASGRIYVVDRSSVLVPPLFVQVAVLFPTPEERAMTPVVVPTNHIRVLADRFNIKQLTVISGTNVTFTNLDIDQHQVVGQLCAMATGPSCDPAPITPGQCNVPDATGVIPCIDSGPMNSHATFTVRLTRPQATVPMRYQMDDLLEPFQGCVQSSAGQVRHACFLTVK